VTIPSVDGVTSRYMVINLPVCHLLCLFGNLHHADPFYHMLES
jgi:hypothetical protein